jgi:hypothetical protein
MHQSTWTVLCASRWCSSHFASLLLVRVHVFLVQCIVDTARFCTHHFEEGTGSGFVWLTYMRRIGVTCSLHIEVPMMNSTC